MLHEAADTDAKTVRLGLVGGGFMGEALLRALLQAGVSRLEDVWVAEAVESRRRHLEAAFGGLQTTPSAASAVKDCDVVLIAVKPQDFPKLAASLAGELRPDQVVLSIMAGVTLKTLSGAVGHERVVRAMPNTPASIGEGFTTWVAAPGLAERELDIVRRILGAAGREAQVSEERYVDMATAINGSGPAYVFLFLEALIDAGVHIGLPRGLAQDMVLQTVAGSVKMAMDGGQHPAQLRNMVTSAGGTTAAGLLVLERAAMRATLAEAVIAAYERSRALGG